MQITQLMTSPYIISFQKSSEIRNVTNIYSTQKSRHQVTNRILHTYSTVLVVSYCHVQQNQHLRDTHYEQ